MMSELSEQLREERGKIWEQCKALNEAAEKEKRGLNAEEQENWDKWNAEIDNLKERIDREERAEMIEAQMAESSLERIENAQKEFRDKHGAGGRDWERYAERESRKVSTYEDESLALQGWALRQAGRAVETRHEIAANKTGIRLDQKELEFDLRRDYREVLREYRMTTSATAGGEYIPEGFVNNLEIALLEFGGMRQASTVMRTATGNQMPWPTTDDTSNTGRLLAEAAATTNTEVVTSEVVFNAYKYSSDHVLVTSELLQDSAFNMSTVLARLLGERLGRITNQHFTTGTGSSQPNGIITAGTQGTTVSAAAGLDEANEVIDLFHSVDPAYRTQPGAGFMCHDTMVQQLRKLQDTTGQYLWQPSMQQGQPDRLLGYPITINQDMDDAGTLTNGEEVLVFGALRKYIIRDAGPIRLRRLVELYAGNDREGYIAFSRHDGDLLDAGTNPVKYLAVVA